MNEVAMVRAVKEVRSILESGTRVYVPAGTYEIISFNEEIWRNSGVYQTLKVETEGMVLFYIDRSYTVSVPAGAVPDIILRNGGLSTYNVLIKCDVEDGEIEHLIIEVPEKDLFDVTKADMAVIETIYHWHRMVDYVVRRYADDMASRSFIVSVLLYDMQENIHEDFYREHCPLCHLYYDSFERRCTNKCPLVQADQNCENEGSAWYNTAYSDTFAEWIDNGREMLNVLYDLLPYDITTT